MGTEKRAVLKKNGNNYTPFSLNISTLEDEGGTERAVDLEPGIPFLPVTKTSSWNWKFERSINI